MLNKKVSVKIVKVKLHKDTKQFSVWHLLAFILVFAAIGGYIIWHSSALTTVPAPTSLTEATLPGGTVNLSWTAPANQSVAGYKIYQYSPSLPEPGETSATRPSSIYIGTTTQTSYQVTGLLDNSAYDFYVVAVDSSGNSSDPTNDVLADTSSPQLTTASALKDLYSATAGTSSSSFPYASPFGDQNCDNKKLTTDTSDDCVKNCTGSSNCGGSCIIVQPTDTLGNTGSCRPMTFQTCSYDIDSQKAGVSDHTLLPTQVDQGVDYNVSTTASGCTYNNPNPKDTQNGYKNGAKTNTRVYAMGDGVIKCVAANPGYGQDLTLTNFCPDSNSARLGKGTGTYLVYKLTAKGAAQGLKIYVAEGCALASNAVRNVISPGGTGTAANDRYLGKRWYVGAHVDKNSVLCELPPNGILETGWANEDKQVINGHTSYSEVLSASYQCFLEKRSKYGDWSTKWGYSFNLFILKSDFNRFSGTRGPGAYQDCADYRLQAKYKDSTWYAPPN